MQRHNHISEMFQIWSNVKYINVYQQKIVS